MYPLLRRHCPPLLADLLIAIWYATLLLFVLKYSFIVRPGEFRYGGR